MSIEIIVFVVIILLFSAIIHEYMHGWAALQLGDTTAKDMGRLTLNPISHIDPIGSLILPAFLAFAGLPILGYAKPVPYNPHNLSDSRYGGAKVAIAGPLSNLFLAVVFGLILRFVPFTNDMLPFFLSYIVMINLVLFIFNLLPIPPLDGSKVLMPFLPTEAQIIYHKLEPYGMFILFGLLFTVGFSFIWPLIDFFFALLTGQHII